MDMTYSHLGKAIVKKQEQNIHCRTLRRDESDPKCTGSLYRWIGSQDGLQEGDLKEIKNGETHLKSPV